MSDAGEVEEEYGVEISIIRGEGLRDVDWFGSSDPYIIITHKESGQELYRTGQRRDGTGTNPEYAETAVCFGVLDADELHFRVFDDDVLQKDELMGEGDYTLGPAYSGKLPLTGPKGKPAGFLHLGISTVFNAKDHDMAGYESIQEQVSAAAEPRYTPEVSAGVSAGHLQRQSTVTSTDPDAWGVAMTIVKGEDLKAGDYFGDSDPYVLIRHKGSGKERFRTKPGTDPKNPVWNEKATVFGINPGEQVVVEVYDHDKNGDDEFLGSAEYTVGEASVGENWLTIHDGKSGHDGRVNINFSQVAKKEGLYAMEKRASRTSQAHRQSLKDAYKQTDVYKSMPGIAEEEGGGYGLTRKCSMVMPMGLHTFQPRSNRWGNNIHYWVEHEGYESCGGAAAMWAKKVECHPDSALNWNTLGGYGGGSVNGVDYTEIECYHKAIELDDGSYMAWTNLGGAGGSDHYSQQLCYEKALLFNVTHIAFLNLGAAGGGSYQGRNLSAAKCFEHSLDLKDDYAIAWVNLAVCGGGNVNNREYNSKMCYERALELDDKTPRAWSNLGTLGGGSVNGNHYNSMQCYEQAIAIDPEYASAWHNLGVHVQQAAQQGEDTGGREAKECFEKACERNPKESEYWNSLGCAGGGKVDDKDYTANQAFEECILLGPKDGKVWYNLAERGGSDDYNQGHCIEQALQAGFTGIHGAWVLAGLTGGTKVGPNEYEPKDCYRQALGAKNDCAEAWANLGTLGGGSHNDQTHTESTCFSKAVEINPGLTDVWFNLAACGGSAQYEVKYCYSKVLAATPTDAEAWYGLAMAGGGDVDGYGKATQENCLEEAITHNPGMSHAYAQLAMLRSGKTGDYVGYVGGGYNSGGQGGYGGGEGGNDGRASEGGYEGGGGHDGGRGSVRSGAAYGGRASQGGYEGGGAGHDGGRGSVRSGGSKKSLSQYGGGYDEASAKGQNDKY